MPKFFTSTPVLVISALLLLQTGVMYSSIRPEVIPEARPLAGVPANLGGWQLRREEPVEADVMEVLNADDILNRDYVSGVHEAGLFVAAFKTQRTHKTPHSPKNCLPGSGWEPLSSGETAIDVGRAEPIVVNRYVISHENQRALVLYWYQSRDRVVANEYKAKFWTVADSIRLNRTDTALVRVLVPVVDRDEDAAGRTAAEFVRSFFGTLRTYLPA